MPPEEIDMDYQERMNDEERELEEEMKDWVKVVRCKDCKYWLPHTKCGVDKDNNEYHNYCKYHMIDELYPEFWEAEDFCSYGERKEQEHEGGDANESR